MHEIGALTKAVDLVESVAKEHRIDRVKSITLEVGELTGFLPVFFEKYFPIVIEDRPILADARLHLLTVNGQALCGACESVYNVMQHEGKCPNCGSREKTVLGGRDFVVKSIEF